MERELAIIGIDPGTTTAYAIIGLDGMPIQLFSSKDLGSDELIARITAKAAPLVIATDKAALPSFVRTVASRTGAKRHVPKEEILISEKREFTRQYHYANDHERDALAAARIALASIRPLLRKIQATLTSLGKEHLFREVTRLVVLREMHITAALASLEKPPIAVQQQEEKMDETAYSPLYVKRLQEKSRAYRKDIELLKKRVDSLLKENGAMAGRNDELTKKAESLQNRKPTLHLLKNKEKDIQRLRSILREAEGRATQKAREITVLYEMLTRKDAVLLKKLPNLSRKELERRQQILRIRDDDILLVDEPAIYSEEVVRLLMGKVHYIIARKPVTQKLDTILPFIFLSPERLTITEEAYFAVAPKAEVTKEKARKDTLTRMVEAYQKARKEESDSLINV